MAHQKKPLICGETVTDGDSTSDSITVALGNVASGIMTHINKNTDDATKEKDAFVNQDCGADCTKGEVKIIKAPGVVITNFTAAKQAGSFVVNFTTSWQASVECIKKKPFLQPQDIKIPDGKVIGLFRYECIEGFIWIDICNATGNVVYSRTKTDMHCPIEKITDPYTFITECEDGYWWVFIKNPKGEVVDKKRTESKCVPPKKEEKKEERKEEKKEEKKEDPKK